MDRLIKAWLAEPALLISAVRAILVCLIGFGLDLSGEQITSIVVAMEAIFALFTRQSVYSPATVAKIRGAGEKRRRRRAVEDVELTDQAVDAGGLPPNPEDKTNAEKAAEVGNETPEGQ